jgi:tripartite-type tricarboxylate transporter receptor subunit TctC
VPARTLKEFVDYAKANPGKVSFGSAGAGTLNHLTGESLKNCWQESPTLSMCLTGARVRRSPT